MQTKERFPQIRSLNRRKSASCGHCSFRLISPPMKYPPLAVIGGSSLHQGFQPWTQAAEANRRRKQTGFPLQHRNPNDSFPKPLSGTAAFGRQAGCKASCENTEKCRGEKPSEQARRIHPSLIGLSPRHFFVFSLCPKALVCFGSSRFLREIISASEAKGFFANFGTCIQLTPHPTRFAGHHPGLPPGLH